MSSIISVGTKTNESIFLRFRRGTRLSIPSNIKASFATVIDILPNNDAFKNQVAQIKDGGVPGIAIESTWIQTIKELYDELGKLMPHKRAEWVPALQNFLKVITSDIPAAERWEKTKAVLHEHVNLLSGWETSPSKRYATLKPVQRENGEYLYQDGDETYQIIYGRRTELEERTDYIANSAGSAYCSLNNFFKIAALVNIEDAIRLTPSIFPKSMRVVLTEGDHWTHFLQWVWSLEWPYQMRPTRWRPNDNLCDPDWLSNDFIATFSERESLFVQDGNMISTPQLQERWEKTFRNSKRQTGLALETSLSFGQEEEVWFEFRNQTYRWKNQTAAAFPTLIVTHSPGEKSEDALLRAFRFLSHLSFKVDTGIEIKFWAECASGLNPLVVNPKRQGTLGFPPGYFAEKTAKDKTKLDFALSLYREGATSTSVYYAFLSFFKVIQLAHDEERPRVKAWINFEAPKALAYPRFSGGVPHFKFGGDVEKYLRMWGRNAVSHVDLRKNPNIVDPDKIEDQQRIRAGLDLVRELARKAIESGLF